MLARKQKVNQIVTNGYDSNRQLLMHDREFAEGDNFRNFPSLPFGADRFDLALSSHFLFLYSDHFDAAFHLEAIRALLRVAREVRIFPLLALRAERSQHLKPVCEQLRQEGRHLSIERVGYELQRGSNEMLRLRRM